MTESWANDNHRESYRVRVDDNVTWPTGCILGAYSKWIYRAPKNSWRIWDGTFCMFIFQSNVFPLIKHLSLSHSDNVLRGFNCRVPEIQQAALAQNIVRAEAAKILCIWTQRRSVADSSGRKAVTMAVSVKALMTALPGCGLPAVQSWRMIIIGLLFGVPSMQHGPWYFRPRLGNRWGKRRQQKNSICILWKSLRQNLQIVNTKKHWTDKLLMTPSYRPTALLNALFNHAMINLLIQQNFEWWRQSLFLFTWFLRPTFSETHYIVHFNFCLRSVIILYLEPRKRQQNIVAMINVGRTKHQYS